MMIILGDFTCQYRLPVGSPVLDAALRRIFPSIPDDARRSLRTPLRRWHAATVKFLLSEQNHFDDLRFAEKQLAIFNSQPPHRRAWTSAMFLGLFRGIDAGLMRTPAACPRPHSCALLYVLEEFFDNSISAPRKTEYFGKPYSFDEIKDR
jgi:hypothetical protein